MRCSARDSQHHNGKQTSHAHSVISVYSNIVNIIWAATFAAFFPRAKTSCNPSIITASLSCSLARARCGLQVASWSRNLIKLPTVISSTKPELDHCRLVCVKLTFI
jgi:hypothetical protein